MEEVPPKDDLDILTAHDIQEAVTRAKGQKARQRHIKGNPPDEIAQARRTDQVDGVKRKLDYWDEEITQEEWNRIFVKILGVTIAIFLMFCIMFQ